MIFKADDRGVLDVRRLRITQKIIEITRFGAYYPLYTDANQVRYKTCKKTVTPG